MALDFTVISAVRQRFGDNNEDDLAQETDAPFVGSQKDYDFWCLGGDGREQAILLFQAQGANTCKSLQINGQKIFGGVPRSVSYITEYQPGQIIDNQEVGGSEIVSAVAQWVGNIMLIQPGVLQENNVLHVEATKVGDKIDNFIIDNVVVLFKQQYGPGPIVNTGTFEQEDVTA